MRPGRLAVLVGTLVATAALYLQHLAVDGAAFRALTGGSIPSIWQELGRWGRPGAVLAAAALVGLSFRPESAAFDRAGGIGVVLLAAGALAGGVLAWQAAGEDAATVTAALGQTGIGGRASAGPGFWMLLAGTGGSVIGAVWDLVASRRRAGRARPGEPPSVGEEDAAAV